MEDLVYYFYPTSDLPTVALTFVITLMVVWLSSKQFSGITPQPAISAVPAKARYWTTFFNYYLSLLIFIALALIAFFALNGLPTVALLVVNLFKGIGPTIPSDFDKTTPYARPIVAFLALTIAFGYEKSPFVGFEQFIRRLLHASASITRKAGYVFRSLEAAVFDEKSGRGEEVKTKILVALKDVSSDDYEKHLSTASYHESLLKLISMHMDSEDWQGIPNLQGIYFECQKKLDEIKSLIKSLYLQVEVHVAYSREAARDASANEKRDKQSDEVLDLLREIEKQLYPICACALLAKSRWIARRRSLLSALGFEIVQKPPRSAVLSVMLEDLSTLCLLLVVLIYPSALGLGRVFSGKWPDNPSDDIIILWPLQMVLFCISMILPALFFVTKANDDSGGRDRILRTNGNVHSLAYLLTCIVSGCSAMLALVGTKFIAETIHTVSVEGGWRLTLFELPKLGPFSLAAAGTSLALVILLDIEGSFRFRAIIDGLIIGVVSMLTAVGAVLLHAGVMPPLEYIFPTQATFFQGADLKPLDLVEPLTFFMGFVIGVIIPSSYRRYMQGLMLNPKKYATNQPSPAGNTA